MVRWPVSVVFAAGCALALGGATGIGSARLASGALGERPHWQVFATRVPNLVAVDARSASEVWAVGDGIVHWDGQTLRVTALPWKNARLAGVSAVSASEVWSVGNVKDRGGDEAPISVRWDGHSWRRIPLPPVAGEWLADVAAPAPADVWAVGAWGESNTRPLLLHWDGSRWNRIDLQRIAPALGQLNAIEARGPNDIWTAGMEGDLNEESYGYTDYVLHYDGHSWRRVVSPLVNVNERDAFAWAVDIGLTGEVWTLNFDSSGNGPSFVRWSGSERAANAFDWMTYENYQDIAAISPTDVWIVGQFDSAKVGKPPDSPLVARWDGKTWRVQHTSFEHYSPGILNAVSAISADDIWAVGNHLIVRYAR